MAYKTIKTWNNNKCHGAHCLKDTRELLRLLESCLIHIQSNGSRLQSSTCEFICTCKMDCLSGVHVYNRLCILANVHRVLISDNHASRHTLNEPTVRFDCFRNDRVVEHTSSVVCRNITIISRIREPHQHVNNLQPHVYSWRCKL